MNKLEKEALVTGAIVAVMVVKIMLGIILFHHWRMRALAEGKSFGEESDE